MEVGIINAVARSVTWSVSDPDLALVEASIGGDASAFEMLVRRYSQRLLRVAQQVTRSLDDAQDAVQETFLNAYQKLCQFEGNSKFSTWLIRIALNESLLILRKRRSSMTREIVSESKDDWSKNLPFQISDWHPNPEQLYGQAELQQILRTALSRLRPTLRCVFVLRDIEGYTIAETAGMLNLNSNVVKVRLHRARLELRETLSRHFRRTAVVHHQIPQSQISAGVG
jgi:RNA polymerase sigma-70 factor, ECF subfamily